MPNAINAEPNNANEAGSGADVVKFPDTALISTSPALFCCTPITLASGKLIRQVSAIPMKGVQEAVPPVTVTKKFSPPMLDPVKKLNCSPLCTEPIIASFIGCDAEIVTPNVCAISQSVRATSWRGSLIVTDPAFLEGIEGRSETVGKRLDS